MNRQIRYMKSILFGSATTALIVALSWSALPPHRLAHADEPAANLLKNGSMEEASVDDGELPAEWTEGNTIDGVKYRWVVEQPKKPEEKKNGYLRIAKTAKRYFPIAAWEQTFERSSDAPAITVTVKAKAAKVTKAIVDAVFLNAKDEPLQHEWLIYIGQKNDSDPLANHDWKEYTGTVAIPPETKKITIALQDYGPGTVMFDDVVAVYEKDASKVKDAVGLDASSEDASKQADITEATTDIFASNTTTKAAPVQNNNPALTSSGPELIDPPATTVPPATSQSQGTFATIDRQSSSMPGTNPALSSNPAQNYPNDSYTQPSRLSSNQAIQNPPNQYGFPAYQPTNVVTYGPAPGYFAQPVPSNVEADQIVTQMVPVTHERVIDGHRVSETTYEKLYRTSDGKQFSNEEAAGTHARTLKLTRQYHKEGDSAAKVQIREDLLVAVKTEYDQMRAERLKEIEELTKRLEEVKSNLDKRDQVKEKIIEKRVEQLLGVDQLYQWDTNSQSGSTLSGQQWVTVQLPPGQPPQYNPASPITQRPFYGSTDYTKPVITPSQPRR